MLVSSFFTFLFPNTTPFKNLNFCGIPYKTSTKEMLIWTFLKISKKNRKIILLLWFLKCLRKIDRSPLAYSRSSDQTLLSIVVGGSTIGFYFSSTIEDASTNSSSFTTSCINYRPKSPLRLHLWFVLIFQKYPVHTNIGAKSFYVVYTPPQCFPIVLQHLYIFG